jgi:quercetin dioxygenase-like cupin family protein
MKRAAKSTAASLHRWTEIPMEKLNDRLGRRMLSGQRVMLAHIYLDEGCVVPRHSHENEQLSYIFSGSVRFTLGAGGEDVRIVRTGEVLVIPSNLPHDAEALEDSLSLDVFSPPRQDWLDGTDAYLRRR